MPRNPPTPDQQPPGPLPAPGMAATASPPPALLISSTGGSWRSRSPGPAANGSGSCCTGSA
jgi:hypothetical protein